MAISTKISKAIAKIIPKLFSDDNLVQEGIWKVLTGIEFDEVNGLSVETFEDHVCWMIRSDRRAMPFMMPGTVQGLSSSETSFIVRTLPPNSSTADQLISGEDVFAVSEIKNLFDAAFLIKTKGI